MINAHWVTSISELEPIGPQFDAMVLAAGDFGLFYQRGWLERVWPYYQSRLGGDLALLIAEDAGVPIALAPLCARVRGWVHARQRVLAFLGGTGDELDNWMPGFLAASEDPDERLRTFEFIADEIARCPWDLLELRSVRETCPSVSALRGRFPGLRSRRERLATPRANLAQGWVSYWGGRSRRLLRMLDRGRNRAAEDGGQCRHEVTDSIPLDRRREFESLHLARQDRIRHAGRARNSPFDDPLSGRVFWELVDWATSRRQLRTHWLWIGPRIAAYVVVLSHAGTAFAYFNAIHPAMERYHPGSLLLAALIEREVADYGTRVVDLMQGSNLTKELFATDVVGHLRLTAVQPGRIGAAAKDVWIRAMRALVSPTRRP